MKFKSSAELIRHYFKELLEDGKEHKLAEIKNYAKSHAKGGKELTNAMFAGTIKILIESGDGKYENPSRGVYRKTIPADASGYAQAEAEVEQIQDVQAEQEQTEQFEPAQAEQIELVQDIPDVQDQYVPAEQDQYVPTEQIQETQIEEVQEQSCNCSNVLDDFKADIISVLEDAIDSAKAVSYKGSIFELSDEDFTNMRKIGKEVLDELAGIKMKIGTA